MLSILKRLALPAALFAALPAFAHDGVHIADPFARIIQGNGAVYFRIDNHADADDRLIGAESPAHMTMLMSTVEDASGMSKMIDAPEGFAIAAGSSHVLAPAGDHVMLMHLMSEPADGDLITVVLIFEKAGRVSVTLPVMNTRRDPPGMEPTPYDVMSGEEEAPVQTGAMSTAQDGDRMAIRELMMKTFDKPEAPLTVDPVVVAGNHALASWSQGDMAGRALLEKGHHGWTIVLCAGQDLRMPAFLESHGVSDAKALSDLFNAAEDELGADLVSRFSGFEGVVMMSEHAHD